MENLLHQRIFEFLEDYRKTHPDFRFWLREGRNDNKLNRGIWFLGDEKEAFISLYNKGGGGIKSKNFGLVFLQSNEEISAKLVNKFDKNGERAILNFYEEARNLIGGFSKVDGDVFETYEKILSDDDGIKAASQFLDSVKPKLDHLIEQRGLDKLFIDPVSFEEKYNALKNEMKKTNHGSADPVKYWVFQANPKIYRIIDALKENVLRSWMVNQFKNEIKAGDKVIIWVSGINSGVYAMATIISNVYNGLDYNKEYNFYIEKSANAKNDRVNLMLEFNLVDNPILKEQILKNPILKDLNQGMQGTNFQASKIQYDTIISLINSRSMNPHTLSLNQILFGPPGTGKTYSTINNALKIINESEEKNLNWKDREAVKALFDRRVNEGRIVFSTFHQSMNYEDFIEGIKPQKAEEGEEFLRYEIEPGIFKALCNKAKSIRVASGKVDWDTPDYYKMSLGGKHRPDLHDWCIENNVVALGWGGTEDLTPFTKINNWTDYREKFIKEYPELVKHSRYNIQATYSFLKMSEDDIVVVSKGNHVIDAIGMVKGPYYWDDKNPVDYFHYRKVEWIAKNLDTTPDRFFKKQISQMTIYQFDKEDVKVDAFKELTVETENLIVKPFVLIIDEINRGNVSQIFGELITLIEEDKRLGREEALEALLPYSKEKFGVPPNLYIIGTMNTADRSVEALDAALRRRFSFVEMPPKPELIATEGKLKSEGGILEGIDLPLVLGTINKRIEKLLDKDHQIGHSYFMSVSNFGELKSVFQNKIIPLLQEYFFGDYGKIGLVLGKGFFEAIEETNEKLFAEFDDYDASEYSERPVYKIRNISSMQDEEFSQAINTLLRK